MKLLIATLLVASCALWADQVTLSNGDRISGQILRTDEGDGGKRELVIKTDYAGEIKIAWDNIANVVSDNPLYVNLEGGQVLSGTVSTDASEVRVQTPNAGTVSAARATVEGIRNAEEQTAFEQRIERLRNPRLIDLWTGFLDIGFASTKGNADTQTFTLSSRADRETTRDKISVYYTSIFASNDTTGDRVNTANSKRGGITYDVNFNKRWFAWGSVELESDEFQTLDLRFVPAGGVGIHAINTEPTQLDFRFGASGNREFFFSGLKRNSTEVIIGEDFSHKFTETTTLQQKVRFFPNVSNSGAYRLNFDTTFATEFAKWFSLQFTISDRYLSNPASDRKSNDILFSTGVRMSFAR